MNKVRLIFEPKSVVLVGSSVIQEKIGMTSPRLFESVTNNMKRGFRGKTYVLDVENKTELGELIETPDLAVIMLPPEQSILQVEKCAKRGINAFIIITGGFTEKQRRHLLRLKENHDISILGPNTILGVLNTTNGLNTTFEEGARPKIGEIAIISQSGGVGAFLLDWACSYNIGISKFAFTGDKIDLDDVDLLQYFESDRRTKVICLYMEGVRDGRGFIKRARKTTKKKPILVLKGGTTRESARRAESHTASIAGSDEIFNAALKKAGIIRVENVEELMNTAVAFTKQPPMRGANVAIVSNVGGPAILAADAIVKNDLKLAVISTKTKEKIENLYPGMSASNPIDIIADAKAERYTKVLELVLADENVDGVLVISMLKSTFFEPEDAKAIPNAAAKYPEKPVVAVPAGAEDFFRVRKVLGETNIPLFNLPEKAARALRALRDYGAITTIAHQSEV